MISTQKIVQEVEQLYCDNCGNPINDVGFHIDEDGEMHNISANDKTADICKICHEKLWWGVKAKAERAAKIEWARIREKLRNGNSVVYRNGSITEVSK